MKIIIEKFKKLSSLTHYFIAQSKKEDHFLLSSSYPFFKKNNNLKLLTKMQYIITENNKGLNQKYEEVFK